MGNFFKELTTKDGLIGIFMMLFFGVFGAMAVLAFDITSLPLAALGSIVFAFAAYKFKESRRFAEKPKYHYVPYIAGELLALIATYFMWTVAVTAAA